MRKLHKSHLALALAFVFATVPAVFAADAKVVKAPDLVPIVMLKWELAPKYGVGAIKATHEKFLAVITTSRLFTNVDGMLNYTLISAVPPQYRASVRAAMGDFADATRLATGHVGQSVHIDVKESHKANSPNSSVNASGIILNSLVLTSVNDGVGASKALGKKLIAVQKALESAQIIVAEKGEVDLKLKQATSAMATLQQQVKVAVTGLKELEVVKAEVKRLTETNAGLQGQVDGFQSTKDALAASQAQVQPLTEAKLSLNADVARATDQLAAARRTALVVAGQHKAAISAKDVEIKALTAKSTLIQRKLDLAKTDLSSREIQAVDALR